MKAKTTLTDVISTYPPDANIWVHSERKLTGGKRIIVSPNTALNSWLRNANAAFNECYTAWPVFMHGGIRGRSYITFAKPHVRQACLITLDIRKCFDSISEKMVAQALITILKLPDYEAVAIAKQICYKRAIAQGFPTSNFVCNLVLMAPLQRIHHLLAKQGVTVTNYVDDIAVSGDISNPSDVINLVAKELSRAGLAVKKAKTKVMPNYERQVICGLLVNRRLSITRQKKHELLRAVSQRSIFEESLKGWLSHLHAIDESFEIKLRHYARTKSYDV